jgi:hypothetical protein
MRPGETAPSPSGPEADGDRTGTARRRWRTRDAGRRRLVQRATAEAVVGSAFDDAGGLASTEARGVTGTLRVTVEVGPKAKKFVAVAPDWPGLERGASSEEDAVERLRLYLPRYARVATLARMGRAFADVSDLDVDEQYPGTGSTDFWGISFAFSGIDRQPMTEVELGRQLRLMCACWTYFDGVRARVSPHMAKGPRGGGRDRDEIVRHVLAAEQDWAKKVGLRVADGDVVTDEPGLTNYRKAYCESIRAKHAAGEPARGWPLRYLVRHTAYHTMDHAWEMEDKDMTGAAG